MAEGSDIGIRAATRLDVDAMHGMLMALAASMGVTNKVRSTARDLMKYGFGATPLFKALIAEKDGQPVGLCIYFYSFSTWLGEPGVYVQDLYVDDALRGSGLGRRLLHATAQLARTRDATHLRLSVDSDNTAAQGFYERVGMHYRAEERIYHIGGEQFSELAGEDS